MISKLKQPAVLFVLIAVFVLPGFTCELPPKNGRVIDFEQESDMDKLIWRCGTWFERVEGAPQGHYWLRAQLPAGQYPGVRFFEFPANWLGYGGIAFTAFAPGKAGEKLHLRIDDQDAGPGYNDRFNRIFTLGETPQRYCVPTQEIRDYPEKRAMRLHKIKLIMVFLYEQQTPTELFLDDFRLVDKCP